METIKPISQTAEIRQLLSVCELPDSDVSPSESMLFFGHHSGSGLAGIVGLEIFDSVALLRSLAVAPQYRNATLGQKLVAFAEVRATSLGVRSLFLLTTTAERYFSKLGYSATSREDAPLAIQSTAQFAGLSPAASSFMSKRSCG